MHDHSAHSEHSDHMASKTVGYSIKDFAPLIIIFVVIILATWFLVSNIGTYDLFTILSNFMAVFFLVFAAFKIANLKGFANAYQIYDLVAARSRLYAYLYPFVELALGLAYLFSFKLLLANWVTLIIMLVGAYGVYLKLKKKEVVPCACLGSVFKVPMTWVTLGEDMLMATMALVMILI